MRRGICKSKHRECGVMLLEATAALFIAAVGISAVIQMFNFGAQKIRVIQEHNIATRAIQNELETLRGLDFADLPPAEAQAFRCATPELAMLVRAETTVHIGERPESDGRLREVTASIVWTTEYGRRVHREVTTLIADKGDR